MTPWQGSGRPLRGRRTIAVALALVCAFLTLAFAPVSASARLSVSGRTLIDGHGGTVILRGGAYVYSPGSPPLAQSDWLNMQRLGWNSIRLGTNWSFIEPSPGVYDSAYLDALASVARAAMAHGLYVILDMHQDLWGPPFGDGAPQWTIQPQCAPLAPVNPGAATGAWQANYLAPWTICQFTSFWQDVGALQAQFIGAWTQIAHRLATSSRLAGYDVFNEPFQGAHPFGEFELSVLYPFYRRVGQALHAVDPQGLIFEEPPNAKNVHLPTVPGDPGPRAVYTPHVYGLWDATEAISPPPALVQENMTYSQLEARAMGVPLWFGEFGMRRGAPGAEATLTQIYDLADTMLAGANYWAYGGGDYGVLDPDGSLDSVRATTLSRTYPLRTAGALKSFSFDSASGRFTMSWTARTRTGATVIYVPALRYPHGFGVHTDPGVIWRQPAGSQLLRVTAAPGPHTLTITADQ